MVRIITFAEPVRPPVRFETLVTALSKSNMNSDGFVSDKRFNSLYEFLIDSRRLRASEFELFDALTDGCVPLFFIRN
jgi:hypothetical protein